MTRLVRVRRTAAMRLAAVGGSFRGISSRAMPSCARSVRIGQRKCMRGMFQPAWARRKKKLLGTGSNTALFKMVPARNGMEDAVAAKEDSSSDLPTSA